jgi:hypothetical protein
MMQESHLLKTLLCRILPVLGMLAVGYVLVQANSASTNLAESRYWIDRIAQSGLAN